MFVKKLQTNLKYEREVDLSACTVITGANAAGKTGIVESLSLALTGESARLGKDGKKALAATVGDSENKDARIIAALDDGGQAVWSCSGTPVKAARPKRSPSETFASVSRGNGLEAIRAGGSKLTDWLADLAAEVEIADETHDEVMSDQPEHLYKPWLDFWGVEGNDIFNGSRLSAIRRDMDAKKRKLQQELRMIAEVRNSYHVRPTPEELSLLEDLEARSQGGNGDEKARLDEIFAILDREELAPVLFAAKIRDALHGCKNYMKLRGRDGGRCPCCHESELSIGQVGERLAKIQGFLDKNSASYDLVYSLFVEAAILSEKKKAAVEPLSDAEKKQLKELKARKATFDKLVVDINNEGKINQEIDRCKNLIAIVDEQRRRYAEKGADILQKLSSRVLPKKLSVEARLRGSNYVLGLERRGFWRPLETLSGAESAMLLAAVEASVCTSKDTPLRMLVIDDVWFDRTTLIDLLKALTPHVGEDKALTQVVVCCVEWRGKPPKGWSRLDLDAIRKEEESREEEDVESEIGDDGIEDGMSSVIVASTSQEEPASDSLGL